MAKLRILKLTLAVVVIILSVFFLLNARYEELQPWTMVFLGAMFLVSGITEFQERQKWLGYLNLLVSLIVFYVAIKEFLL